MKWCKARRSIAATALKRWTQRQKSGSEEIRFFVLCKCLFAGCGPPARAAILARHYGGQLPMM
jgi:hypothetical protein